MGTPSNIVVSFIFTSGSGNYLNFYCSIQCSKIARPSSIASSGMLSAGTNLMVFIPAVIINKPFSLHFSTILLI